MDKESGLPLDGIRVLEFTSNVMGPAAGLLLADFGAEVIHIEPPKGDPSRRLKGFGIGYFPYFNRNKKSLALDIKSDKGKEIIMKLAARADVIVENFAPGTMERLGLGYEDFKAVKEDIIYCSCKGFLSGPFENRTAMDEPTQMRGGLAYMTGPPGKPTRAGTSVIDITGGMFGFIGVMAAIIERNKTGKGQYIKSALYETTVFLMGQHMACSALTGEPVPPMPARVSAWSIYRIFDTKDEPLFVGIISEKHWQGLCDVLGRDDWANDERLSSNNKRIDERDWLLPELEELLKQRTRAELIEECEKRDIPVAPICKPEDLFDDPQLNKEKGGLIHTTLPSGVRTKLPRIPVEMGDHDFGLRNDPPPVGADTVELMRDMGYSEQEIKEMIEQNIAVASE